MRSLHHIYTFYRKPFLLLMVLNLVSLLVYSVYFEEYEGIFSSFVQGVYTKPCLKEWNVDVHFIFYSVYAYINQILPGVQVYGLILLGYNWISLTLLGLVLFRIIRVNLKQKNKYLFVFIYLIISLDSLLNLSTNRIAFTVISAAFFFVESKLAEQKEVLRIEVFLFFTTVLFSALLRFDFAILASMIYLLLQLLNKSLNRFSVVALIVSISVALVYNMVMMQTMSEARQIYYYKELDFIMRNNFDYATLSAHYKMEVDAFYNYIFDDIHLTWNFYNAISVRGKGEGIISLFFGLHWQSFLNTLNKSVPEYKMAWYYILFAMVAGLFLTFYSINKYWLFHLIILLFFPLLFCFYVVTPLRFLVPYYSILGSFYTLIYVYSFGLTRKTNIFMAVVLVVICYNVYSKSQKYQYKAEQVKENLQRIKELETTFRSKNPIVINNFSQEKFFPVNAINRFDKQYVLFQNLYYFMSYDCYIDQWREYCTCNPLRLKDKIDYVVDNQCLFIVQDLRLKYLKKYLQQKYDVILQEQLVKKFDNELNVYTLSYSVKRL